MERNTIFDGKYLRLVYCLVETCSKSARRLLHFYLEQSRPDDFPIGDQDRKWTIDVFLYQKQKIRDLNKIFDPDQMQILFPGHKESTDVDRWDISLLFKVLEMFHLDKVITKDITFVRKMRNRIFHAGSTLIEDGKFDAYKQKISVYVQNCCDILGDQTLAKEIEDILKEADETKLSKETQTRVLSDFDNWFKSDPLFECIDRIPSDIGSIMDVLFEQIVNLLRDCRFKIPDAYLSLQIKGCNPSISELVSEQLYRHLCEETSPQGESRLGRAIADAHTLLIDKHRRLVEVRQGCLILRIQSEDFEGFWCLISDCISGKLTSSWLDVQNIVREEHGAPYLTIDVGVTTSEIISCVDELVQHISEGMQIGNEIPKSLLTKRTFHDEHATKEQATACRDEGEREKPQVNATDKFFLSDESLRIYFKLLSKGFEEAEHIRLMVIGMHGVGKTSLIRRLCNKSIGDVVSTEVIDINRETCEVLENGDWKISTNDEIDRVFKVRDMMKQYRNIGERRQDQPVEIMKISRHEIHPETEPTDSASDVIVEYPTPRFEDFCKNMRQKQHYDKVEFDGSFGELITNTTSTKEEEVIKRPTVTIWDFAGQSMYYSTHHFFLNSRSIYIIALDLSKKLQDEVCEDESSEAFHDLSVGNKQEKYTCLEAFKFWMKSIFIYTKQKKMINTGSKEYKPKIILVGTFKDKIPKETHKYWSLEAYKDDYFREALFPFRMNKPLLDLVHKRTFLISNTDDSANVFLDIKKEISNIASGMPFWKEKIPAKFIPLEREIYNRKRENQHVMMLKDLTQMSLSTEYPQAEEEIKLFLEFQHAAGSVLYFNTDKLDQIIILTPQWILDAFKALVSHKQGSTDMLTEYAEFKKKGKLDKDIIHSLLKERGFSEHSTTIIDLMEHLDVLVRPVCFNGNAQPDDNAAAPREKKSYFLDSSLKTEMVDRDFFVMPFFLSRIHDKEKIKEFFISGETEEHTPILCFYIKDGFLPPFVVHRMFATCLKEMPVKVLGGTEILFTGFGSFSPKHDRYLTIWAYENIIYLKASYFVNARNEIPGYCRKLRERLEHLLVQLFNFHGRTNYIKDNKKDLFDYRVKCHECPEQLPYQLKEVDGKQVDYMYGLLNVDNLMEKKIVQCQCCNKHIGADILKFWFDPLPEVKESTSSFAILSSDILSHKPASEAQLAEIAELVVYDVTTLAQNLNVPEKEVQRIRSDYCWSETTVAYHVLYNWMGRDECWRDLYNAAFAYQPKEEKFLQILRQETDNELLEKVQEIIRDINRSNEEEIDDICLRKVGESIREEYWLFGIRLGVSQVKMERMKIDSNNNCEIHIKTILQFWKTNRNSLQILVAAMVKSHVSKPDIINCFN